ncbi:MAG: 4Fe-4S binding protein [Phycisphaerae bacterium]
MAATVFVGLLMLAASPDTVLAQYERPVDTAPTEEDIGDGYQTPDVQRPAPRAIWWNAVDTGLLVVALGLSAFLVLSARSRGASLLLAIACLLYFGFFREGCVCPIGAIQNVTVALTDATYAIPVVVIVFFFLPLLLAFVFGRVFCGGVCPLGAIQEVVLLKPIQLPRRLDKALGTLKYIYLLVAIWFAAGAALPLLPAVERDFIICRFDPFVGFFRLTGSGGVLIFGGALLVLGLFVGRPYCRFLCPYGALLAIASRFAWRGVTITPDAELDCGLCAESCPYGAIEKMRAVRSSCLFCARCYAACPREPENQPRPAVADDGAAA